MLRMSAKAVFDDHIRGDTELLRTSTAILPELFVSQFKKNVIPLTPKKTGALRRSIITQVTGNKAYIAWRLPYAIDQNLGYDRATGRVFRHYTTEGTGADFVSKAYQKTYRDMQATYRELGLVR